MDVLKTKNNNKFEKAVEQTSHQEVKLDKQFHKIKKEFENILQMWKIRIIFLGLLKLKEYENLKEKPHIEYYKTIKTNSLLGEDGKDPQQDISTNEKYKHERRCHYNNFNDDCVWFILIMIFIIFLPLLLEVI